MKSENGPCSDQKCFREHSKCHSCLNVSHLTILTGLLGKNKTEKNEIHWADLMRSKGVKILKQVIDDLLKKEKITGVGGKIERDYHEEKITSIKN